MKLPPVRGFIALGGALALTVAGPTMSAFAFQDDVTDPPTSQQTQRQPTSASTDEEPAPDPLQELCDEAFADQPDAHEQCSEVAQMLPPEDGGDGSSDNPFQQFCDEAFADDPDAHEQCSEFASNFDDGDPGDGDDGDNGGGEDDSNNEGEENEDDESASNPFQQFCDEAFADDPDAHEQCSEFATNFEDDGSSDSPFQQFCDEAFADDPDAHEQCSEFASNFDDGEPGDGDDGDNGGGEDDSAGGDDTQGEDEPAAPDDDTGEDAGSDRTAVLGSSTSARDGALASTGANAAAVGAIALCLLALGIALVRRVRPELFT